MPPMLLLDVASAVTLTDVWGWSGWTSLAAIGTLALALATGILALITARSVRQTRHLVSETKDLVKATDKSASAAQQTVDEIRRDRELEYQPYLSWKLFQVQSQGDVIRDPGRAEVANFGRLCCATWITGGDGRTPYVATTELFDLSPNEKGAVPVAQRAGFVPATLITIT